MTKEKKQELLDAIVVGGGIAGLTAAYRLRDRNIILLEKDEVPGGRTVSRNLGPFVYNAGAQVVLGNTSPLAKLVDEIGVKRTLIAKSRIPFYINGKLVSSTSRLGLLWKMPIPLTDKIKFAWIMLKVGWRYKDLLNKEFDPQDPKVVELNSNTVSEFIGKVPKSIKDIWEVFAVTGSTMGSDVVTPFHPLMVILFFMEDEYYVEGGTNQITITLREKLGDKVRLDAEVSEVKELDDRVQVTYNHRGKREILQARQCIMATPAPITLKLITGLAKWKQDSLEKIEYGSMTTAAFLISEQSDKLLGKGVWRIPVSGQKVCALTDPSFTFSKELKDSTGQGLLRVYTGNVVANELMSKSDGEVSEILMDDLFSMVPQAKGKIVETDVAHWRHALPLWKPGHMAIYETLQQPTGRIHYCGDYTSPGFMNGSVLSAYRVIKEMS